MYIYIFCGNEDEQCRSCGESRIIFSIKKETWGGTLELGNGGEIVHHRRRIFAFAILIILPLRIIINLQTTYAYSRHCTGVFSAYKNKAIWPWLPKIHLMIRMLPPGGKYRR